MTTIGIIGAGYWGPNLIRNFSSISDCQVKYVCDSRPGRLDFISEKYPQVKLCSDYSEILSDTEVDGVVIATPVASHFQIATDVLKKGKDVFIEKPFTETIDEAEKLVRMAGEGNRVLMVGHLFEYHPAVTTIKHLIDAGSIGDVYYIDAVRINMGPPESKVNVIWDLAPHDLSIILFLLGKEPIQIKALGKAFNQEQWKDLVQVSYISLEFSNNQFAQIHNSWLSPNKTRRLEIFGSKGVIVYDDMKENKLTLYDEGVDSRKDGGSKTSAILSYGAGKIEHPEIPAGEPLKIECEHFIQRINDRQPPRSNGQDGLSVIKIIEKANLSIANSGKSFKF